MCVATQHDNICCISGGLFGCSSVLCTTAAADCDKALVGGYFAMVLVSRHDVERVCDAQRGHSAVAPD